MQLAAVPPQLLKRRQVPRSRCACPASAAPTAAAPQSWPPKGALHRHNPAQRRLACAKVTRNWGRRGAPAACVSYTPSHGPALPGATTAEALMKGGRCTHLAPLQMARLAAVAGRVAGERRRCRSAATPRRAAAAAAAAAAPAAGARPQTPGTIPGWVAAPCGGLTDHRFNPYQTQAATVFQGRGPPLPFRACICNPSGRKGQQMHSRLVIQTADVMGGAHALHKCCALRWSATHPPHLRPARQRSLAVCRCPAPPQPQRRRCPGHPGACWGPPRRGAGTWWSCFHCCRCRRCHRATRCCCRRRRRAAAPLQAAAPPAPPGATCPT